MIRSSANNRRHLFRSAPLAMLFVGWAVSPALADEAEYIEARGPIRSTLKDDQDPIEGLDIQPPSWVSPEELNPQFPVRPPLPDAVTDLTGESFWSDATLTVNPRAYYFHRKFESGRRAEATTIGGSIDLQTGWYRDILRFNVTGFTSQKISGELDEDGTGNLRSGQEPYTVLGVASAELKIQDAIFFGGRTELNLPYINGKDSRMTPNTFEGAGFYVGEKGKDKLRYGLAHLTQIKFRNSSIFVPFSEQAGVPKDGEDRGVTAVALRYDLDKDTYLGFTDDIGWDTFNTFYTEGQRYFELGDDIGLRIDGQFTQQDSVGDELVGDFSTHSFGAKAGIEYGDLVVSAAVNKTGDGGSILAPWGGSPTYRSMMISDEDRAGETALTFGLTYDFSQLGLKGVSSKISWMDGNTPDHGKNASPDEEELSVTVDYRPKVKSFENFWLRLRWAQNDRDQSAGGEDREDFRVILNYTQEF